MGTRRRSADKKLPEVRRILAKNPALKAKWEKLQRTHQCAHGVETDLKALTRRFIEENRAGLDRLAALE